MPHVSYADRLEAAILKARAAGGSSDLLALIVMPTSDATTWLREVQASGLYVGEPPICWPPGEFMGVVVFEDPLAPRSYLLSVKGHEHLV